MLSEPVFALAWGVLVAGLAQLLFQLPFLHQLQLLPKPRWHWQQPGVQKILRLMLPAIFGVSVSQINLLLDTVLASFLPTGSVSWLYYSDRLAELPLGVFGIAIATVILPNLSRLNLDGEHSADAEKFRATLDWALRCIVVIALPASLALMVLAEPILYLLFQYNAMQPHDVTMAAHSLRAYSLGLLAFMAIKVLATGYYSQQDTKTPVKIGIIAMVTNMALNLVFVAFLYVYFGLGHVELALATSISALLNAALLYRGLANSEVLHRAGQPLLSRLFWRVTMTVGVATALMSAVLFYATPDTLFWQQSGFLERLQTVLLLCSGGFLVYLLALAAAGLRPAHFITSGSTSPE